MIRLDTTATFYDVQTVQDPETGNRYTRVLKHKEMVANEEVE